MGIGAQPAANFQGNPNVAVWLPNAQVANAWAQYVKTGAVDDTTPPPAPFDVKISDASERGTEIRWSAEADFESGIRRFIIMRDGKEIGSVPEKPIGKFGRPLFQSMTYHDTPAQPMPEMRFVDATARPGEKHTYEVVTVNSVGLKSSGGDRDPDPNEIQLYNGKDLTGWGYKTGEKFDGKTESDDKRFSAEKDLIIDHAATPENKGVKQLWTTRQFPRDFELKLEFRASVNADSGLFVRSPQLQVRDYLVAGPYKQLKKYKAQDWNEIIVVVKGNVAHCTCNGEVLEDALKIPDTGGIGLEADRGTVEYRNIRLTEVK